ncbi:ABC transporter ATP-binding protein [Acetobacteraceae bacterium KSS8]|uniref:ABC transporter ATP-binding protein n=1 Tax=Endosaccharibacter trunci TaxID=2812733 RepID=A0ABT1W5T4_9PROT|nr:ABC transporter ATP-binding protein [Acetobacteraceae bacterium KSS8]
MNAFDLSSSPSLEIEGVRRAFGETEVLRGVDLTVRPGELLAILGASGGGKTTLLRLVCGFERADSGRILIGGVPVDDASGRRRIFVRPEKRGVGYVAQDGALFPHLSVSANILFGLGRADRSGAAADRLAAHLLELVGLPAAYAARSPQTLSGGEQQRVALARALAPKPRLVLLDEPFSALDAGLRAGTRRAVADALHQAGAAALLVTHDQGEALSMGDRVGVLRDGRLVQVAAPATLYRRPVDAALASFVGEAVLLEGWAQDRTVRCPLGEVMLAPDCGVRTGAVQLMLRPEQIALDPNAPCRATVETISYYGHDAGVVLRLAEGQRVSARIDGGTGHALQPGTMVGVAVIGEGVAFPVAERHEAAVAEAGAAS